MLLRYPRSLVCLLLLFLQYQLIAVLLLTPYNKRIVVDALLLAPQQQSIHKNNMMIPKTLLRTSSRTSSASRAFLARSLFPIATSTTPTTTRLCFYHSPAAVPATGTTTTTTRITSDRTPSRCFSTRRSKRYTSRNNTENNDNNNNNNNNTRTPRSLHKPSIRQPQRTNTTTTTTTKTTNNANLNFQLHDKIQVEIISFGPLGASVHVVGVGHDFDNVMDEDEEPLAKGLVLQREIAFFRQARDNLDVVRGEVLPAYVERVRADGRIDVTLRPAGGSRKTKDASELLLEALRAAPNGELPLGDKSTPADINKQFPGTSKVTFKKAVARLYRLGKAKPGPFSIRLVANDE